VTDKFVEAVRAARRVGAFHEWFDPSGERGHWDFAVHVLTPEVCARIERPYELTALEIGYGGGRLLNAACDFFGDVVGVDVHEEEDEVRRFLAARGRTNFRLLRGPGDALPVEDASVDFVYSFIVLQHLPSAATFRRYLEETARVLRPGGVAQLYYGRLASPFGHVERPDAPVNDVSLLVGWWTARRLARGAGLRVVGSGRSFRNVPDDYPLRGGQAYLTLLKP
jgi:SAM-dependent methyltransferase